MSSGPGTKCPKYATVQDLHAVFPLYLVALNIFHPASVPNLWVYVNSYFYFSIAYFREFLI